MKRLSWLVLVLGCVVSVGFVIRHFVVFARLGKIESSFAALEASSSLDGYRQTGEVLKSQLANAGYSSQETALANHLKAIEAVPKGEDFVALKKSALPHECPCRLSAALLSFGCGLILFLRIQLTPFIHARLKQGLS